MARLGLARWRCWWSFPLGHADEVIDYVDALSGRGPRVCNVLACGRAVEDEWLERTTLQLGAELPADS